MEVRKTATDNYPARGNEFNGKINWVQIDLEPDDHSHMIDGGHMAHVRLVNRKRCSLQWFSTSDPDAIPEYKALFEFKWEPAVLVDEAEYGPASK